MAVLILLQKMAQLVLPQICAQSPVPWLYSFLLPFPQLNSEVNDNFLQRAGMCPSPFTFDLLIKFFKTFWKLKMPVNGKTWFQLAVTGMKILVLLQGRKRFFTATCKGELSPSTYRLSVVLKALTFGAKAQWVVIRDGHLFLIKSFSWREKSTALPKSKHVVKMCWFQWHFYGNKSKWIISIFFLHFDNVRMFHFKNIETFHFSNTVGESCGAPSNLVFSICKEESKVTQDGRARTSVCFSKGNSVMILPVLGGWSPLGCLEKATKNACKRIIRIYKENVIFIEGN